MTQEEKRQLENELTVMGLPGLENGDLVQALADVVNGYPVPAERADFFSEMLNECVGAERREMYEAMRPLLSFPVPSLDACEARIAAKAERMIRPRGFRPLAKEMDTTERIVAMECGGCGKTEPFADFTTAGAMLAARNAGWGRGPRAGLEYCASCRLITMPMKVFGNA